MSRLHDSLYSVPADAHVVALANIVKYRDAFEVQDLYRRTLAAHWFSQPCEAPADECVEDIFSGGNGWGSPQNGSNTDTEDDELNGNNSTLRPRDYRRMTQRQRVGHRSGHQRSHSRSSDQSASTVTAGPRYQRISHDDGSQHHVRAAAALARERSGILDSMQSTLGSDRGLGDTGYKPTREVSESEVRDNLVAWKLPGALPT